MKPIPFPEQTKVLTPPEGVSEDECQKMAVFSDGEHCISCWRAGFWERLRFLFTGRIWLWVWFGETQPPVCVDVNHPFRHTKGGE